MDSYSINLGGETIQVKIDPSLPPGEIHWIDPVTGEVVAKLTNEPS